MIQSPLASHGIHHQTGMLYTEQMRFPAFIPSSLTLTEAKGMKMQNEGKTRTWFVCNGNDGHCCDNKIELHSWSWNDDAEPEYWFGVYSYPQSFWNLLKYWLKHRKSWFLDISLSREDLIGMKEAIEKELNTNDTSNS